MMFLWWDDRSKILVISGLMGSVWNWLAIFVSFESISEIIEYASCNCDRNQVDCKWIAIKTHRTVFYNRDCNLNRGSYNKSRGTSQSNAERVGQRPIPIYSQPCLSLVIMIRHNYYTYAMYTHTIIVFTAMFLLHFWFLLCFSLFLAGHFSSNALFLSITPWQLILFWWFFTDSVFTHRLQYHGHPKTI